MSRSRHAALALLAALLAGSPAFAQTSDDEPVLPAGPAQDQSIPGASTPEPKGEGFWDRANLFGDVGGLRSRLIARGLTLSLSETDEVLGNPTGGRRQTVVYGGLTRAGLAVDIDRAFGLPGGTFKVTGYQIHGCGLSLNALGGNLHTVSNIEASNRGTLLGELWYEQAVLDGKFTVRAGQLLADVEFLSSEYAGLFTNATFGWPTFAATVLPSGGPAYPLAVLGIRVKARPAEAWTVLGAVFNGDPSGPEREDRRAVNPSGTAFRLSDGVFAIAEVQYALGSSDVGGLPGIYKIGGWYHTPRFDSPRRSSDGLLLADPLSNGQVAARRGNWSLYAVADQLVWREDGTKDQGIGVFARVMGGPGDRNLLNFYADAGVTWKGALPGRMDDTLGLAVAVARFSDAAAKSDSDTAYFTGEPRRIRRNETVIELAYQAQVAPWWIVQPTAQYVANLNGGAADPARPGRRLPNAVVLGLRTGVTF